MSALDKQVSVVAGDVLTLTIKGKVIAPGTSANGIQVRVAGRLALPGGVTVNVLLGEDAVIEYDVKSRFRNGVHIDGNGRYWMRRPDGWHEMSVNDEPLPSILGSQFSPPTVQRLTEDRDS